MTIPALPPDLSKTISNLMIPFVATPDQRQALIQQTFQGEQIIGQLDYTGDAKTFGVRTVTRLYEYNREAALIQLLETLRDDYLGENRRKEMDQPITQLRSLADARITQPILPDENTRALIDTVHDSWIAGVLEKAITDGKAITISAGQGFTLRSQSDNNPGLANDSSLSNAYYVLGRRLLILGKPGAGKTIAMLQIVDELLDYARKNTTDPIPVVLNLSSWAQEQPPLKDWIITEMDDKYGFDRAQITTWIGKKRLVLCLDGLDEVAEVARDACVEAINDFLFRSNLDAIICSREEDYDHLEQSLNIQAGVVVLQDLTQQQIDDYLADPSLLGLRQLLEEKPKFKALARSPFLLNTMWYVYRNTPSVRFESLDETDALTTQLLSLYVSGRLAEGDQSDYNSEVTEHYLRWLATAMTRDSLSEFYIERMQPSWLRRPVRKESGLHLPSPYRQFQFYTHWLAAAIIGVGMGAGAGVAFGFATQRWQLGLTALVSFMVAWFWIGFHAVYKNWGWRTAVFIGLFIAAAWGIAGYLTSGWPLGAITAGLGFITIAPVFLSAKPVLLSLNIFQDPKTITLIDLFKPNWETISQRMLFFFSRMFTIAILWAVTLWQLTGPVVAVTYAVPAWLSFVFTLGIALGFEVDTDRTPLKPNQGIRNSWTNALQALSMMIFTSVMTYVVCLGVGSLFTDEVGNFLVVGLLSGGIAGLGFGLTVGLVFGGYTVLQHLILRLMLQHENAIPKDYAAFLDHAVKLVLLRRVGGGYIFIHRDLQEFLADTDLGDKPNEAAHRPTVAQQTRR